jgi:crotonobetainyl-CoA:carnitine CoA-transferase CaiB-like acyl-CoA transferase
MMARVLSGVNVIELGTFITGPCASMLLADLGADVLKIEQPGGGDPFRGYQGSLYSPHFRSYNARKRSIALNLKSARATDVVTHLAAKADVLIENYRPGVMDQFGLGWKQLQQINPRLIYCSVTGFGSSGPYRDRPCYDTVAQSLSGYLSQTMSPEQPQIVGPAVADTVSAMYAAYGVLGALVERGHTGVGRHVEVAMLDSMIAFGAAAFGSYFVDGKAPGPISRPRGSQSYALRCADGKLIALHLASVDKFFQALAKAIGRPELADDPRFARVMDRQTHYELLTAELSSVFVTKPLAEWVTLLLAHDVPHAPVATLDEVVADPQVRHNRVFTDLHHPTQGTVTNTQRPVLYDGERQAGDLAPPTLGEHSAEVLRELGYDAASIDAMALDGVVQCANPVARKSP